mgnify:CR=1 FL=1
MNKLEVGEKRPLSTGYIVDVGAKKAESDIINEQTKQFIASGGKITILGDFGVQSMQQPGYGAVALPNYSPANDHKRAKRNFLAAARSCFARGEVGMPIYFFKNDAGNHFRNDKSRGPIDSKLVKKFKSIEQVVAFKLPKT